MKKLALHAYRSYEQAETASLNESLKMAPEDRIAATDALRRFFFGNNCNKVDRKHIERDTRPSHV
jgi:hypothetical protein